MAFTWAATVAPAAMAAVTFVASSVASGGSNSQSPGIPAGTAAGDLMLMIAVVDAPSLPATPSGWTFLFAGTNGRTALVYYKIASASQVSPTLSGAGKVDVGIMTFTGVDQTTPIESQSITSSPADLTTETSAVTASVAGGMEVITVHSFNETSNLTNLGSFTDGLSWKGGENQSIFGIYKPVAAAGTLPAFTVTRNGNSGISYGGHLVLKPSSGSTSLHHVELSDSSNGSGLTCTPSTLTVKACADAACSTPYTLGVSGTLSATGGSGTANWGGATAAFTIPAGSNSVTKSFLLTGSNATVSTVLGTSSTSPAAGTATSCTFAGCTYTAANAGFVFNVANFVSGVTQNITVAAVRKSDNANVCVPAFASVTRSLNMGCTYQNPTTGTLSIKVAGVALNPAGNAAVACSSTKAVNLSFDSTGTANTTLDYADVGQILLSMTYAGSAATGDSGLSMTGSNTFIAAPKDFAFGSITAGPIKAGNIFSATVTARNALGATTPNFGKEIPPHEGVTLTHTKVQPSGAGAAVGTLSGTSGNPVILGSFGVTAAGTATDSNLTWSEVGTIDLTATLSSGNYLLSGLNASGTTGNTGAVGRFIPDHFTTVVTQGCVSGNFTYAGQPFSVQVTAQNLAGNTTLNYASFASPSSSFSQLVSLSDGSATPAPGSLSPSTIPAASFAAGTASASTTFTYSLSPGAPASLKLRAVDADNVSSSNQVEGQANLRSGRLRMFNAYGSELLDLPMTLIAQYWSGTSYVLNSNDSCTTLTIPTASSGLVFGSSGNLVAGATTPSMVSTGGVVVTTGLSTLVSGDAGFKLSKPGTGKSGYVDITITAPSWLKFPWVVGGGSVDPTARATFGVYKSPLIYLRENY